MMMVADDLETSLMIGWMIRVVVDGGDDDADDDCMPQDAKVRFMICTDVAARGIDVSGLPFGMYQLGFSSHV